MRSRLAALLLVPLLLGAGQPIDPQHLAWDSSGGPDIVAGYEVVQGWDGVEVGSTVIGLSVPLPARTGTAYAARVRALPVDPEADPSNWATLAAEWPDVLPQITSLSQLGRTTAPLPGGVQVMAAPTFVAEYATAFNTTTKPKTAMSAVAINSGDVLVGVAAHENEAGYPTAFTENGSAAWASQQSYVTTDYCETIAQTYTATTGENLTVTLDRAYALGYFGGNVVRFSGSDGVGASNKAQGGSGSPSVSLTTTQNNSAIVVICTDWNAVSGTQTFTNNFSGTPAAMTDFPGDATHYGVAIAYFPDAGTAGSKTVGMSAPTGQKWTIIAVEVKGTAGAAATSLPPIRTNKFAHMLVR